MHEKGDLVKPRKFEGFVLGCIHEALNVAVEFYKHKVGGIYSYLLVQRKMNTLFPRVW